MIQRETNLVSVLMPVYNGSDNIKEAIQSILGQTYSHIELIIVDDGSTDNTLLAIDEINSEKIKVLKLSKNSGIIHALNVGIVECRGEFIARMDADDICHPSRLQNQVNFLKNNPDFGLCGTSQIIFGGYRDGINAPVSSYEDIKASLLFGPTLLHPTVMFRSALIQKIKQSNNGFFYNKGYKLCEDYELWTRMIEITKVCNISTPLCYYRWTGPKNWEIDSIDLISGLTSIWEKQLLKLGIKPTKQRIRAHLLLSGRGDPVKLDYFFVLYHSLSIVINNFFLNQYSNSSLLTVINKLLPRVLFKSNFISFLYAVFSKLKNFFK